MLVMEMSSKQQQIPAIRFNGFTDAWEQRKLGEITEVITKGTTPLDKSWLGPVNYVKTESINPHFGNIIMKANTSMEEHEGYLKRSQLKAGDVLFSIVGTIGRVGLVQEKDVPANTNQQIAIIRLNNADKNYVFNALKTPRVDAFIKSDTTIGAQPSLSLWQIEKLIISYPGINEQTKIGTFFNQLDNTISLHQRQLDNYKELKKSMLQKVLPQEEEKVPEIRFDGFTGDWEQRKLGEIAEITSGGTPSTNVKEYWEGDIDWYSPVEIGKERYVFSSQRKITEFGLKKSSAKILPANKTILFTSRAGIGDMAILMKEGATNQGFQSLVLNERYDIYFVYSMGNKIKEFALKNAAGSTFLEISGKGLAKMELLIPTLEEQTIIGSFFKNIDDAIELHKRKVLDYQQLKKAMLQQMFV